MNDLPAPLAPPIPVTALTPTLQNASALVAEPPGGASIPRGVRRGEATTTRPIARDGADRRVLPRVLRRGRDSRTASASTALRASLASLVLPLSLTLGLVACAKTPPPSDPPPVDDTPTYARHRVEGGETIHALRTGWVRVKRTHRELDVVRGWRFPAIITQREWASWMPIVVYAIERTDGSMILVDTGPSPRIMDADYFGCDPRGEWFYRRNLDFRADGGDNLRDRMAEVGLDPGKVTDVVISHFHADHVGGLDLVPTARVLVGEGNWPKHTGSFTCSLGPDFKPTIAAYDRKELGPFTSSLPLTPDGHVAMVPLPGHTPGHAGVAIRDGDRLWIVAGDATFDDDQSRRGAVSGATQDVKDALETQGRLANAMAVGAVLLPAHDLEAFSKLAGASLTE